jgi:hypothetical protein
MQNHQEHPGHLNFAMDAWTSPNHCAFIAWTVHLEHQDNMLAFLLDVVEVPEVCVSCPAPSAKQTDHASSLTVVQP